MSARRPYCVGLQRVESLLAESADLETIQKAVTRSRNEGSTWPFEREAFDDITAAKTLDEVRAVMETLPARPEYRWPFEDGEAIVNTIASAAMPLFQVYRVVECYEGYYSLGETIWVRIEVNGEVSGYDPDRFVRQSEFVALREARAGNGSLLQHAADCWTRPGEHGGEIDAEAAVIGDAVVQSLIDRNVMKRIAPDVVVLNEGASILKKCGIALSPKDRVVKCLRANSAVDDAADAIVKEFALDA